MLSTGLSPSHMERWQHYSQDPNAPALYSLRRKALSEARASTLLDDRIEYLCRLATGKSVLDIGIVEHTSDARYHPGWLHGHLARCAARCLGVDVLQDEVNTLRTRGYNVLCADITQGPLSEQFDLIV